MSKKMAGKTFSTPEEAGMTPPTEEELAHARKQFDELQERIDRVARSGPLEEDLAEILERHVRHRVRGLAGQVASLPTPTQPATAR